MPRLIEKPTPKALQSIGGLRSHQLDVICLMFSESAFDRDNFLQYHRITVKVAVICLFLTTTDTP